MRKSFLNKGFLAHSVSHCLENKGAQAMKTRFGDMVGSARRARRITLKELGTAIGLGASIISEMEHGHRLPPADSTVVEKFAKFLGLD